jgi:hypothetical protein
MPSATSIKIAHVRKLCLAVSILTFYFGAVNGQTKFYAVAGIGSLYYHNSANGGIPTTTATYYGVEIDKYLDYHYAFTTGVFYLQGGYDNSASRWTNTYIQVPLGIKMASLGDQFGIELGFDVNYLLHSELRERADPQNNYYTLDVTSAMKKIQPDFYFGLLFRLNRVTAQWKMSFSLTNRYSTDVKAMTDPLLTYYSSFYADDLGKEEPKLTCWTQLLKVSVRLF